MYSVACYGQKALYLARITFIPRCLCACAVTVHGCVRQGRPDQRGYGPYKLGWTV